MLRRLILAMSAVTLSTFTLGLPLSCGLGHAQEAIEISPDETVLVERYVRAIPAPPPVVEEHTTLRPGSVIPAGVPLQPFEKVPALARYVYFVSVDHKIVVADPKTRVVVRILDQKS